MVDDTDSHLAAIAAGDPDAFGRWVAGCEARLRASLSGFAESVDCEAVLQETLLRVWQVAPRIRPDGRADALLRFAVRTARNLALDECRRIRLVPTDPPTLEAMLDAAAHESAPDPALREVIARCREKLPPRPAAALAERLEGDGVRRDAELAERLGMRLNTFLQNLSRARRLLLECLRRHGISLEVGP